MAYVWIICSFVLTARLTENPVVVDTNLERLTKLYHDIGDEVFEIVNSDMFEKEIMQLKALYLTDKGFYVPDELRNDEDMLRMGLGKYANGGPNADRVLNTNKMSIKKLENALDKYMDLIEFLNSEYQNAFDINLIFLGISFKLENTRNLLDLYVLLDECDTKIKLITNKPNPKSSKSEIIRVLISHQSSLEGIFLKWLVDMKKSRRRIETIASDHQIDASLLVKNPLSDDVWNFRCETLRNDYVEFKDYHLLVCDIFDLLKNMLKGYINKTFCLELKEYGQTLLCYDLHVAKIFAKETKKLAEFLRQKSMNKIILENLLNLFHAISGRIYFYNYGIEVNFECCNEILEHYNSVFLDDQLPYFDFDECISKIIGQLIEAKDAIQDVRKENLPELREHLILTYKQIAVVLGVVVCAVAVIWCL